MGQKKSMLELHRMGVEEYRKLEKLPVTVVLDNVRSEMNVGSVFRTADAFMIERIVLCGITPQPPKAEIHKTALGAEESVSWQYCPNIIDAVEKLKCDGYTICSIEQVHDSVSLENFNFSSFRRNISGFCNNFNCVNSNWNFVKISFRRCYSQCA